MEKSNMPSGSVALDGKARESTVEVLDRVYKNSCMGSSSVIDLMPKVKESSLRSQLTAQLSGYDEYSSRAAKLLREYGVEPKEEGILAKAGAKVGIVMSTVTDTSSSKIADMVIQGSNMGITDLTKLLNGYEKDRVDPRALSLAEDVVSFEENNVSKMKKYL